MAGVAAERLISCIKKEQSIWNIHSPDFLEKQLKVEAWNRVCSTLIIGWDKQSVEFKQNKFSILRKRWDKIRGSYRTAKNLGNSQTVRLKKFRYYDQLAFLDTTLDGRKRGARVFKGAIGITNGSLNVARDDEEKESSELEWNRCSSPQGSSQNSKTPMQMHDATTENFNQQTAPNLLDINPSLAFLLSCSQEMDEMTANQRIEFKCGMINLLKSLKYPIKTEIDD